jgi:hypothetical protein
MRTGRPWKLRAGAIPEDSWTERVSNHCCVCGGICDPDGYESRDRLEHDEDCAGCPLCELPLRLFRELPDGRVLGVALHLTCLEDILEKP